MSAEDKPSKPGIGEKVEKISLRALGVLAVGVAAMYVLL
jgi:hypothetical protein